MLDSSEFVVRDLLDRERISTADLDRARAHAEAEQVNVVTALEALGAVPPREIAITRAAICESPYVDLERYDIDINHAELLPRAAAEKHGAFPLFCVDDCITVGMVDPLNLTAVDAIRQLIKREVVTVLCDEDALRSVITRAYNLRSEPSKRTEHSAADSVDLTTGEEPIVAAVNQIIRRAIDEGVSDIHINPDEHALLLRCRIDGVLQTRQGPGLAAHSGIVQRIKVMSSMDLTQTRRPQDGKFRFQHESGPVDVRVSTIPTVCGENIVLRLLRQGASLQDFHELGMRDDIISRLNDAISMPHGMILVTGPTGSGKTTTLYTALSKLNSPERNLMTIEDPVEIRLPMVRQTQVQSEVGLTFAGALRSILRQDPDVILIGEIRDQETAKISVQAALTGHLLLSTLHTNDAVGAIARLRDFGLPSFAINSALLCVLAQRIVRRVCPACARPDHPDEDVLRAYGLTPGDVEGVQRGEGCVKCLNTGYHGRVGLYEILPVTPRLQSLIEGGATSIEISEFAVSSGMKLMFDDGLEKARLGLTTLEELWKVRTISDERAALEFTRETAMRKSA